MNGLMRTILPQRAPNGDFGGRSFQSSGGPPVNLRADPIGFPGAPDVPRGNTLGVPEILRDTPGRRSNVTVQYARVVPTGVWDESYRNYRHTSETESLTAGELAFVVNDDKINKRGKNNEKMARLASIDYVVSPQQGTTDGGGHLIAVEQMHQLTHGNNARPEVVLAETTLDLFNLPNTTDDETKEFQRTPFLVWRGWDRVANEDGTGPSSQTPYNKGLLNDGDKTEYDDLTRVRDLWELIYTSVDQRERSQTATNENPTNSINPPGDNEVFVRDRRSGLLDVNCMGKFRPDGFVLYKFSTEGDAAMEAMMDARQNAMYNIVIGGHATVTSWVVYEQHTMRQRRLLTMPRDAIYLLVTGRFVKKGDTIGEQEAQYSRFEDLRYVRSTSEELHRMSSGGRLSAGNVQLRPDSVVLGAWRLGSVVDNAAARSMPQGAINPIDVKSTMAITVSTSIRWVTSYELHETYWHETKDSAEDKDKYHENINKLLNDLKPNDVLVETQYKTKQNDTNTVGFNPHPLFDRSRPS